MKVWFCMLCFSFAPLLFAQKEKVLPEPSAPPYEVGAVPLESGYTIERENAPDLNFRIVENKMRLYWLDKKGLIMEPEISSATIRFDDSGRLDYHRLKPLSSDTALGSPYILAEPHRYYVTLVIGPPELDEVESYRFRYTPTMDKVAPAPEASG